MAGRQHFNRAFSLVEMLMVLGMFVVLLGLLLPALAAARDRAIQTQCAGHLRSIGRILAVYRRDHDAHYPKATGAKVISGPHEQDMPEGIVALPIALKGYLKPDNPVHRCPGDEGQVVDRMIANGWSAATSYVYWGWVAEKYSHNQDETTQQYLRGPQGLMHDFIGESAGDTGRQYSPEPLHERGNTLYPDNHIESSFVEIARSPARRRD